MRGDQEARLVQGGEGRGGAHHFSATMPLGVSPSMYRRPLPTRPKLAELATAMRESKKGEYLMP